jgi:two-component system phosphate regulon response regulator PhoB
MTRGRDMARILIIEDERNIQRLISYALQTKGHDVSVAQDGSEGLCAARTKIPDLILLDIVMPEMSGMEVLIALKADESLKSVPVLIVTASAQKEEAEKAIEQGAAAYLIKPFHVRDLHEAVASLLGHVP